MSVTADDQGPIEFRPQPGFQERVASCTADIAIVGGAAGCGKSFMSVLEPTRNFATPGFDAIIFRRTFPSLRGAGSVWEEGRGIYPHLGGVMREVVYDCRFPSGATVTFSHLQRADDVEAHKSKAYALVIFEELTEFLELQFWYMLSRNRTTCGVRPYMRATCNPDPDSFVRGLIDWWIDDEGFPIPERSGVVRWLARNDDDQIVWGDSAAEVSEQLGDTDPERPKSFTFIPGTLDDNRALTDKDPSYRSSLQLLPRVERARLLGGNWNVKAAAGDYYQRGDFEIVDAIPGKLVATARGWDRAASVPSTAYPDPDYTAGVKLGELDDGRTIVLHVERCRRRAGAVKSLIKHIASQEPDTIVGLFQDPAAAGKGEAEDMVRSLKGYNVKTRPASSTGGKLVHAAPFSSQAEHGNVVILRGDWNEPYLAELESFPRGNHDDQVDGTSVAFELLSRPRVVHPTALDLSVGVQRNPWSL